MFQTNQSKRYRSASLQIQSSKMQHEPKQPRRGSIVTRMNESLGKRVNRVMANVDWGQVSNYMERW